MQYVDLHTHTSASDGTQPPAENVRLAAELGLAGVAVTDHDTVAGIEEALRAGRSLGITVVPGVEISTVSGGEDIHVLGYFIDHTDEQFLERLAELRAVRARRNEMMLERLNELGVKITMDDVLASLSKTADETIGRPHIADAMMRKGYVGSLAEAFERYLGKGGAAYLNPPRIEPATAVKWIMEAGGAPVLAHPGLYDQDELIPQLAEQGLAGLEAYHSDHSPEQEDHYRTIAEGLGLIITAGSDFHGERGGVVFHAPIGSRRAQIDVVHLLSEAAGRHDSGGPSPVRGREAEQHENT
ncbi:PHP domain-containing protein [Paenibacillus xerothermodurans]|uniref:PHP domain-containing protein n=1 Tax=Paenibacillus xerothermodurans TaxID=1977292 RepID=A0A2W1NSQ0_PAEXE|nr:PHP domain-containing protein [Paenibacillus xerothermodurans]PZE22535.1 PHP domain-containing protein [Paenibacillus xerothermodurans]